MKHPTLKVPPERWPLHGYLVCAVTQIWVKTHKQIGFTYADWYERLDWNCFCWCLMKHAGLDTVCHDLYTSSTQNNDYLQKKESLPHHFQLFFFRWIRRDCRYVPCRSLELQKAAQLGFIIHFVHESQHVILMESLFAFTIFFTIPSWFLWTIFLQEILSRLETWLAELEVLLDRRIERRSGVLERRGVSEMSSLMCGLVLCEVDSCFWGVLKPLNLSFLRSDTVHEEIPKNHLGCKIVGWTTYQVMQISFHQHYRGSYLKTQILTVDSWTWLLKHLCQWYEGGVEIRKLAWDEGYFYRSSAGNTPNWFCNSESDA